jgi:holo-[acyl-carrier protein] synthase
MIYNNSQLLIGFDVIELDRIQVAIEQNQETFISRILTNDERIQCTEKKENKNESISIYKVSSRFSGKEAIAKMLGTGIGEIAWKDIEILQEQSGRPYVQLYKEAENRARMLNIESIDISLCHTTTSTYAIAIGCRTSIENRKQ